MTHGGDPHHMLYVQFLMERKDMALRDFLEQTPTQAGAV